jgi:hypothetical protein
MKSPFSGGWGDTGKVIPVWCNKILVSVWDRTGKIRKKDVQKAE